MVLLFGLPVFFSYGIVFEQGWAYYARVALVLVPFIAIAGALGAGLALALVAVFPARRLKDFLFLASIVLVIGFYLLLRLLRPERLLDPDAFYTVIDYLAALETPASPLLPSQWAADILGASLFGQTGGNALFLLGLVWVTAGALVFMLNMCFNRWHLPAWSKAQEGRTARMTANRLFNAALDRLTRGVPLRLRAIVDKDIRVFLRDTSQWSQLLILGAIILIYLYNFSVLPLDTSPIPTRQLQNLLGFLNLGLAGFVIAAVAVRFAYPAVSLEGQAFWVIRSSPLSLRGFLWCKLLLNTAFLSLLAVLLIFFSNRLLRVEPFMMWLSLGTILLMTLCLTSLSVGLGAAYPRFRFDNIAQIPTGFGGLLYMILALLYIGTVIVLEAWPVHMLLMANLTGQAPAPLHTAAISASLAAVLLVSGVLLVLPLRIGLRRIAAREQL
jgi:ABC-2 type transport system permease protein